MTNYQPYIFAALSACISSVGTVFSRGALATLDPLWVTSLVPLFGGICFSLFLVHRGPVSLLKLFKNRELLFYACVRSIGAWLFIEGTARTSATNAIFLTKIEPYCILLWAWILGRETIHRKEFALLAVHLAGAWILTMQTNAGGSSHTTGDLLIAFSMLVSGFSYFFGAKLMQNYDAREIGTVNLLFSGIVGSAIAFFIATPLPTITGNETSYLFLALHGGTFTLMYLFWLFALRHAPAWKVSALRALGPLAGLPAAYFILNEPITERVVLGGLVVIITSFIIAAGKTPVAKSA